jgi:hypothetical protein
LGLLPVARRAVVPADWQGAPDPTEKMGTDRMLRWEAPELHGEFSKINGGGSACAAETEATVRRRDTDRHTGRTVVSVSERFG